MSSSDLFAFATGVPFLSPTRAILAGTVQPEVASVELFSGTRSLGLAAIGTDGLWSLAVRLPPGPHAQLTARVTDASGTSTTVASPFTLATGIIRQPFASIENDFAPDGSLVGQALNNRDGSLYLADTVSTLPDGTMSCTFNGGTFFDDKPYSAFTEVYSASNQALSYTYFNNDGTVTATGVADGAVLVSTYGETLTGGGQGETFVFAPHEGHTTVTDFIVDGTGHDTLDLSATRFTSLAQMLRHTNVDANGNAVIHLSRTDTITLEGVSKQQFFFRTDDVRLRVPMTPAPSLPGSGSDPGTPPPGPMPPGSEALGGGDGGTATPAPAPPPAPVLTIDAVDGGLVNAAAASAGLALSGTVAGIGAGASVAVAVTDGSFLGSYNAPVLADGTWSTFIPATDAQSLPDGTANVNAQVVDGYGAASSTASGSFAVHESLPTVTLDAVAGDDVIDGLEAQAPLTITGASTGSAGQPVTVTLNGVRYTGTVANDGTWSAPVPATALGAAALPDGAYVVTADVRDVYGNIAREASQTVTVRHVIPSPALDLAAADQATPGSHATHAGAVTLVGTGVAGDAVALTGSGTSPLATTVVDTQGHFRFANVALAVGDNALAVTDTHGTLTASAALTVTRLASTAGENVATAWNRLALQSIAVDGTDPERASRALAMESLAVYNAVNAIDGLPGYLFSTSAPSGASADAAAAQAAHDVLLSLFPSQAKALDAQLATSLATVSAGPGKSAGTALGAAIAADVIALRANDGWNTSVVDTGSDGLDQWHSTGPGYMPAEEPQWGSVTPFVLASGSEFVAPPPPTLDSQAYAQAYNETMSLGAADSTTRTADETQIAKFWADGTGTYTPPGAWNAIADNADSQTNASLSQTARTLALLNFAEADAAITTWNTKFTYNTWRPTTAAASAGQDGNPDTAPNPTFEPLIVTPPHPEYVSGHSTFSSAAAAVLDSVFGSSYGFSTTSSSLANTTRSFTSFDQAAAEAGMSRIYGGIHFQFSVDAGAALGKQVGDAVLSAFDGSSDTTAPKISVDQTAGLATNGAFTLGGHVTDNLSGVASLRAALDGGAFATVAFAADGSFQVPLTTALRGATPGTHTLSLVAIDAAGNVSPPMPFAFSLAPTPPQIALSAGGVADGGVLTAGVHAAGSVALSQGDGLAALSYSLDGGAAVPLAFASVPTGATFDQALALGGLVAGTHTLAITATDRAGNATTDTLHLTSGALPLTIAKLTPSPMTMDVGVTYRPEITFSRPIDPTTLDGSSFYATDSTGAKVAAVIVPFADGSGAWMLFKAPLAGASTVTLHVDGSLIRAVDGTKLDATGMGAPGSALTESFATVSTAGIPGTTISGIVVDPGPDDQPMTPDDVKGGPKGLLDYANDSYKLPIAGAKVYILGHEGEAVITDSTGHFTLTDVPAGDVKVAVDGRTATNAPADTFFPEMVMDVTIKPGVANTLMGSMGSLEQQQAGATNAAVYLPRLASTILTPLSADAPTTVVPANAAGTTLTRDQLSRLSLTVQPGSVVDANGNPLPDPVVGISPVPPALVMDMLPPGVLQHTLDITIQAPGGAVFTKPATLTVPNTFGMAPGETTYILSYDHTTGRLVIDGTATVSADGQSITSDPGSGVLAPGWHGVVGPGSRGRGRLDRPCGPVQPEAGISVKQIYDAEGNLTTPVGIVATGLNEAALPIPLGVGRLLSADAVGHDTKGIADDVLAFNNANDPVEKGLYVIKGFEDSVKWSFDLIATVAPTSPYGKAAGFLSSAINFFDHIGAWAAGDDPFEPLNTSVSNLVDQVHGGQAMPNWSPPPGPDRVQPAFRNFENKLSAATADFRNQQPQFAAIATTLTGMRSIAAGLDPANPAAGLSAASAASLAGLMSDFSNVTSKLASQPSLGDAVRAMIDAANAVIQAAIDANFVPIDGPMPPADPSKGGPGPQGPTIVTESQAGAATFYAALKSNTDGSVQRFAFDPMAGIDEVLAPGRSYTLTAYDPGTETVGEVTFTSAASGVGTALPDILMMPDGETPQANGLTAIANYVLGFIGTDPFNIVSGVSDAVALKSGLYGAKSLASTTGVVGALPLRGEAQKVALAATGSNAAGLTAYVATGSYGLAVVDASDPRNPVVLGQLKLAGTATDVAVDRALNLAVVALGGSVAVVDVRNPSAPVLAYTLPVEATQAVIIDGTLYAAANGALSAYDLASGSFLRSAALGSSSPVTGMASDGATLYLFDQSHTLQVVDTSNDKITLEGSLAVGLGNGDIAAGGGIVYVAAAPDTNTGGYATVDVSNPNAPTLLSGVDAQNIAGGAIALNGSGRGVLVGAQQQYDPTTGTGAVQNLVDVVNTTDPVNTGAFVAEYKLPQAPVGVTVAAGTAFVADGAAGLQVVNYAGADTAGVAPTVEASVTTPDADPNAPGLQFHEGQTVRLDAKVSDDVQARSVDLLVNGKSVLTNVSYPWDLSTVLPTIAANGGSAVTLQVRATDTGGKVGLSTPIIVQLIRDPAPFSLVGTSVLDGGMLASSDRSLTFDFSKAVDPNTVGAASFALIDAAGQAVAPASLEVQSNGTRVRVTYPAFAAGAYTLDLHASAITDTTGAALGTSDIVRHFSVGAYTDSWVGQGTGTWSNAARWSTGDLPGPTDDVLVALLPSAVAAYDLEYAQVAAVTLSGGTLEFTQTAQGYGSQLDTGSLTSNAMVALDAGSAVQVSGAIGNSGEIDLGSSSSQHAWIYIQGSRVALTGGGTIKLNGSSQTLQVVPFTQGTIHVVGPNTVLPSLRGFDSASAPYGLQTPSTLVNVDNTITGFGQLAGEVTIDNETGGVILANGSFINMSPDVRYSDGVYSSTAPGNVINRGSILADGGAIQFAATNLDNRGGTLLARNNGIVEFLSTNVNNTGTTIQALDNSELLFDEMPGTSLGDPKVTGGTIAITAHGAAFLNATFAGTTITAADAAYVQGRATFDGTTSAISVHANMGLESGSGLEGAIVNTGHLSLRSDATTQASLELLQSATLSGGGTLSLYDSGAQQSRLFARDQSAGTNVVQAGAVSTGPAPELVLSNIDNIIEGSGLIGVGAYSDATTFKLVNGQNGVIDGSDQSGGSLVIDDVDLENRGQIYSGNGGSLSIVDTQVDNTAGFIGTNSVAKSTLQLSSTGGSGTAISGGTLETDAAGTIAIQGTVDASTAQVINQSGGTFHVSAGSTLILAQTFDNQGGNNGLLGLAGDTGGDALLALGANLTLIGGGLVVLSGNNGHAGAIDSSAAALQSDVSTTLTNVDNTIMGMGRVGDTSANPLLSLDNQSSGHIDANGGDLILSLRDLSNEGTIQSSGSGHLSVAATTDRSIDNQGTMKATGQSQFTVAGAFTNDGVLETDDTASLTFANAIDNYQGMEAYGGSMIFEDIVGGGGQADLFNGSVEFQQGSVADAQFLSGGTGQLILDHTASYTGSIINFDATHAIDLRDLGSATKAAFAFTNDVTGGGGSLTITNGVASENLHFAARYAAADFTAADDGHGGTTIGLKHA